MWNWFILGTFPFSLTWLPKFCLLIVLTQWEIGNHSPFSIKDPVFKLSKVRPLYCGGKCKEETSTGLLSFPKYRIALKILKEILRGQTVSNPTIW